MAAYAGPVYAQSANFYFDAFTQLERKGSRIDTEGMVWGYFHTGTLSAPLTISAGDPVAIQLYDRDQGERDVGGANDEVQVWMSDTDLTAAAGESVRFEFFSVIPADLLDAADDALWEKDLELTMVVQDAPDAFLSAWSKVAFPSNGRNFDNRSASFDSYPAATHVVKLYYVHPGRGFGGLTPGGKVVRTVASAGAKKLSAAAAVSDTMVKSSTTRGIWEADYIGRNMTGMIIVENTSDRDALTVNLDYMKLMEDDRPNLLGNDDDLLAEGESTAPANFILGPGGTLKWTINVWPEWEPIEEARDFLTGDGDLEPFAVFSVNGDPDLPLDILSDDEVVAFGEDQPLTTFTFSVSQPPSPLPPPPTVTYENGATSYTVDEEIDITCVVTDGGGGIVFDTCVDVSGPAWSFPAGTSTFSAVAYDTYGQEGSGSISFDVDVTYDSLVAITERFVDHSGIENSLTQKIKNAKKAKTDTAADALIEAFINEVEAQTDKYVTEQYAEVLIYWAEELEAQ